MRLPASVQEIADVIGRDRALYLVGRLPRCYMPDSRFKATTRARVIMYVPKRMGFDHELVKILGWADAEKLRNAFAGEILHPAPCSEIYRRFRDVSIRRMARDGHGVDDLAEWFNLGPRQVKTIISGGSIAEITQEGREAANDNTAQITNRAVAG